ncbi:hypothetical protein ACG02S_21800 [Roseateles sp. DC23W]|uniref:Uncharacterized protein n=1 Tax=Pelomonas dachongensis TaxID=3299029 RepID=A0ABW7ESP3_9BURK
MTLNQSISAVFSIALLFSGHARAVDQAQIDEVTAAYPVQKLMTLEDTKRRYALTGLYKSKEDETPVIAFAEVHLEKNGVSVAFRLNLTCAPTDLSDRTRPLPQQVISVGNQKVEAYWVCSREPSGEMSNLFLIKSDAGKTFVNGEFSKEGLVFVRLNGTLVPFNAKGFSQALSAGGGKAL